MQKNIVQYQKQFAGLFTQDKNWIDAYNTARDLDPYGDWVCINTRDSTYEEIVETCIHESAHELFAGIIEDNPEKIEEIFKVLNATEGGKR